ncbi:MAG TPA: DUF1697 domain-containing protein [Blastocatellia bacterium]|nr:DUF1697 domain-containing protein [Blastocatellia bacterium]
MKQTTSNRTKQTGQPVMYAAFLRGINLGGHKQIKMAELKKLFESMGFQGVRTVLNSGNVLFQAGGASTKTLGDKIEKEIEKAFGHKVAVILRTIPEIQEIADSDPFKKVKVTPETRLYITFLSEKPTVNLKLPNESPQKDFKILSIQDGAVFSVVTLTPQRGTTEAMADLEKQFGKRITTRNWNTVTKMLKG